MALYQQITITDAGSALMSRILTQGGAPLTFEAVAVGSGEMNAGENAAAFTALKSEAKRLPVETVTNENGRITVTARLATDTLSADLYHREVGIFANGILLAYGNTGTQYDYIPAAGKNAAVQKIIRVPLAIGTMQHTFAEMDTTDLVTHAALAARVATVVEPVAREHFTTEVAEKALTEATRDVAREVSQEINADTYAAQVKAEEAAAQALISESNINIAIDKALFEAGEYRTTTGTQDLTARCFEITKPTSGKVDKIEIPCRTTSDAYDKMYKGTPVFLSIFEQDTAGEWVHIGISTNANTQTAGVTAKYTFSNLKLSGRPIRFIVVTSTANTQFDTSLYMGARVTSSTAGAAYEESSLDTAQNYLADVTFSGAYLAEKYIPAKLKPLNAYQLFMGQDITEIPEDTDLTRTMFAYQMCWDCKQLTSISGLQMPSCMNAYGAFYGCSNLSDISGAGFSLAQNCSYMFDGCTSLTTISNANFEYAEVCYNMFAGCKKLTSTGTASFNGLIRARYMFSGCSKLENITSMRLELLEEAAFMFKGCILNLASVKHIANNINTVQKSSITLGINAELQGNTELATALETIRSKGWTITEEYNTKTA